MKTNFFTILITCFLITSIFAQKSVNDYKYVIVPNKYDFLKEKDQYQLNSLSKFLFEKYGFTVIMEGGEYPVELNSNRCLAMKSDVVKDSGMFATKLTIILKDCNEKEIYKSALGESREKEFKTAYNMALRDAFKSIEALKYEYNPNGAILAVGAGAEGTTVIESESAEVAELKKQIAELESTKAAEAPKQSSSGTAAVAAIPVAMAVTEAPKEAKEPKEKVEEVEKVISGVLYAQEIDNGYQLVDSSPKVVYKVHKTHLDGVFLVEGKSAIVFMTGGNWVVEYYENNVLKQQTLNIKF